MGHLKSFGILTLLLVQWCRLSMGQSPRNVTIDDNDPRIDYNGAWEKSLFHSLDAGGYHMMTKHSNATATFDFTGVAIYYLSPLWPYRVTTGITLSGGPSFPLRSTVVDLRDHSRPQGEEEEEEEGWETVQSSVVWSATNLENGTYHLQISVANNDEWGVLDQLIFTTLEPETTTTSSGSPEPSGGGAPRRSKSSNALAIGLGVGLGGGLLLVILILAFFYVRSRRRQDGYNPKAMSYSDTTPAGTPHQNINPISDFTTAAFSQSPQSHYSSETQPMFVQSSHQSAYSGVHTPLLVQSDQDQTLIPTVRPMEPDMLAPDELPPPPSYYESNSGNQNINQASSSSITNSNAASTSTNQQLATGGNLILLGPDNLITVSEKGRR